MWQGLKTSLAILPGRVCAVTATVSECEQSYEVRHSVFKDYDLERVEPLWSQAQPWPADTCVNSNFMRIDES